MISDATTPGIEDQPIAVRVTAFRDTNKLFNMLGMRQGYRRNLLCGLNITVWRGRHVKYAVTFGQRLVK